MGINWAEHVAEVEAPIEVCFDAIVDYESFPGWQSAVTAIEVASRDGQGLGRRVSLHISTKGQRIDYTLDYAYERPERIGWDFVEGHGVNDVDGTYTFEDLGGGRTRATYRLGIDPSLPIPGVIARRIHDGAVKTSVQELKGEAERRHGAAAASEPAAAPPPPERGAGAAPEEEPAEAGRARAAGAPSPSEDADDPIGQALSLGHEVAREALRAGLGAAGLAIGAAGEVAGKSIELGMGAVDGVKDRLSRLLGSDRAQ